MSGRRERWSISGEILRAIASEVARDREPSLTSVALRANIAHDRLRGYLGELKEQGLLMGGTSLSLTPRGREFLAQYCQWVEVMTRFGINGSPAAFSGGASADGRATPAAVDAGAR